MKRKIAILGSTGSIGTQTLDIVRQHRDLFEVELISANSNTYSIKIFIIFIIDLYKSFSTS